MTIQPLIALSGDNRPPLRLPNRMTRPGLLPSLASIGLYATLQSLLLWQQRVNLPLPRGGLRAWARQFSRDGQIRFDRAWRELSEAGLLKGVRISRAQDRFEVLYTLLDKPDAVTPTMLQLRRSEAAEYCRLRKAAPFPQVGYLEVSTALLNDRRLLITEKWFCR